MKTTTLSSSRDIIKFKAPTTSARNFVVLSPLVTIFIIFTSMFVTPFIWSLD